jgi:hypothetical protein
VAAMYEAGRCSEPPDFKPPGLARPDSSQPPGEPGRLFAVNPVDLANYNKKSMLAIWGRVLYSIATYIQYCFPFHKPLRAGGSLARSFSRTARR